MDIQNSVNNKPSLFNMMAEESQGSEEETNLFRPGSQSSGLSNTSRVDLDTVSISYQAQQMREISKEFFSGTIKSSQIPELTRRLYEAGFINEAEFTKLSGTDAKTSAVSEAKAFINKSLMQALQDGDKELSKELEKVAKVLANMNNKQPTAEQLQAETDAFQFIEKLQQQKQEEGADKTTLEGLKNVLQVFGALAKIRSQEMNTNALQSYAKVQETYDEMFGKTK